MKVIKLFVLMTMLLSTAIAFGQSVESWLSPYYSLKEALIADDSKAAAHHAGIFQHTLDEFSEAAGLQPHWAQMKSSSEQIGAASELSGQREHLSDLSTALFAVLKAMKVKGVYYQYCPMKKAYWLSNSKEIRNPYYGKKMLGCGSISEKL